MSSQNDPEAAAIAILSNFGAQAPPVDVEKIAWWLGAVVTKTKARGGESGFTLRTGDQIIIGVNNATSPRRQRFTIAHEIGHVVMHEGRPLIVDKSIRTDYRVNYRDEQSSMATNAEEIQANAFAACLLMPKEWVLEASRRITLGGTVSREELVAALSREFDVSIEAMGFRLINLGILTA